MLCAGFGVNCGEKEKNNAPNITNLPLRIVIMQGEHHQGGGQTGAAKQAHIQYTSMEAINIQTLNCTVIILGHYFSPTKQCVKIKSISVVRLNQDSIKQQKKQ